MAAKPRTLAPAGNKTPPALKPLPRVLELRVGLSAGLVSELEQMACKSGMYLDEVASLLLEHAALGARRVILASENLSPSWQATPIPAQFLRVPVTRALHRKLRRMAQLGGRPMEEVASRILERTTNKTNAFAPIIEALQQVYQQRRAELDQRPSLRLVTRSVEEQNAQTKTASPERS